MMYRLVADRDFEFEVRIGNFGTTMPVLCHCFRSQSSLIRLGLGSGVGSF